MEKLKRNVHFLIPTFLILLCVMEVGSSQLLFWYQWGNGQKNIWAPDQQDLLAYKKSKFPSALASIYKTCLDSSRIPPQNNPTQPNVLGEKDQLFDDIHIVNKFHPLLGWQLPMGNYRFLFTSTVNNQPKGHDWKCTIKADGSRFCGDILKKGTKKVFLFGESWTFGWGLDDCLTSGAFLQSALHAKQIDVTLYANAGWGHMQALRNVNSIAQSDRNNPENIYVVFYAQWMLPRNLPSPSVVNSLNNTTPTSWWESKPPCIPLWSKTSLDFECLPANQWPTYATNPEPSFDRLVDVTEDILSTMGSRIKGRKAILIVDGPTDELVNRMGKKGWEIWDAREIKGMFQKDNLLPFDAHPGPLANAYWAEIMSEKILGSAHKRH